MKLLVTGAAGMLGHRLVASARAEGHDVAATDLPDLDLTDAAAVRARLAGEGPEVVVHCAAYTDVDGAEADEATATRVNGEAAGNVARDPRRQPRAYRFMVGDNSEIGIL